MRNKKYWIIAGVVAVIAVVGIFLGVNANNNSQKAKIEDEYNVAMENGKNYVQEQDYLKAAKYFDRALSLKKNDVTAKAYRNQANSFANVKDDMADYDFEAAKKAIDNVLAEPDGYKVMTDRAKKLDTTVTTINSNIQNTVQPLLDKASAAEDRQDYNGAVKYYDQILKLDFIKGKYYTKIFQQVIAKKQEATLKAKDKAASESSSRSQSIKDDQMNTEGATDADKTIDGNAITADMINTARQQVTALGYNSNSWSSADIMRLIKISYQNGNSQITTADVQQFLKG